MRTQQEVKKNIDVKAPRRKGIRPRNRYFGSLDYVPPLLARHQPLTLRDVQDCFKTRIRLPLWASDNTFDGE